MWTYFVKTNGIWKADYHADTDIEMIKSEDNILEKYKSGSIDDWIAIQRSFTCSTEQNDWEENICKLFNDSTNIHDLDFDEFDDEMVW